MTPELRRPSAILLDWDGTIVDSMAVLHAGYNIARAYFGLPPVNRETTHAITMYESRHGLTVLLEDEGRVNEGLQVYTDYVVAHHLDHLRRTGEAYEGLLPNAAAFLEHARALGIPLGIVTNKRRFMFDAELAQLGWQEWFATTICANETLRNKPSGDPALAALQRMNVVPGRDVWFLGDTGGDMNCALEAGLTSIYVGLTPLQADWHCDHVVDYESLIKTPGIKAP